MLAVAYIVGFVPKQSTNRGGFMSTDRNAEDGPLKLT